MRSSRTFFLNPQPSPIFNVKIKKAEVLLDRMRKNNFP